jgi:hypothetical protein
VPDDDRKVMPLPLFVCYFQSFVLFPLLVQYRFYVHFLSKECHQPFDASLSAEHYHKGNCMEQEAGGGGREEKEVRKLQNRSIVRVLQVSSEGKHAVVSGILIVAFSVQSNSTHETNSAVHWTLFQVCSLIH